MICVRCKRPLTRATLTVGTSIGPRSFGPKCAQIAGLAPKPRKRRRKAETVKDDPAQRDLIEELETA